MDYISHRHNVYLCLFAFHLRSPRANNRFASPFSAFVGTNNHPLKIFFFFVLIALLSAQFLYEFLEIRFFFDSCSDFRNRIAQGLPLFPMPLHYLINHWSTIINHRFSDFVELSQTIGGSSILVSINSNDNHSWIFYIHHLGGFSF